MGPNFIGSRKFGRKSSNDGYYVANNYPTASNAAQPKSKTKLLIIVVAAAVVLISLFAIIGSVTNSKKNSNTDEDFIRLLDDFNNEAYWFKTSYDNYIGFDPSLNIEENPIFPFEDIDTINSKLTNLEEINVEIQAFDESRSGFEKKTKNTIGDFKAKLNTALTASRENVDFLKQIKDTFYDWFYENRVSGTCTNSKEISALISSNDESTSKIASKYKSTLCNIATQLGDATTEESFQYVIQNNIKNLTDVFEDIENKLKPIDTDAFELNSIFADLNEGKED